jgi:hypothetical protein
MDKKIILERIKKQFIKLIQETEQVLGEHELIVNITVDREETLVNNQVVSKIKDIFFDFDEVDTEKRDEHLEEEKEETEDE